MENNVKTSSIGYLIKSNHGFYWNDEIKQFVALHYLATFCGTEDYAIELKKENHLKNCRVVQCFIQEVE